MAVDDGLSGTAQIEATTAVDRRVDEVFAFVSELQNLPRWDPLVRGSRRVSEGPIGVGTTYRLRVRAMGMRGTITVRCTGFEPGRKIAFENSRFGPIAPRWEIRLASEGAGTRVIFRANPNPQGPFKPLLPLIARWGAGVWRKNLAILKEVLESEAARGPAV